MQQVLENQESTARQYALIDSAQTLGWPAERILLIDEDQGMSGTSAAHRVGFQRLLTEVTLDHVGIVLGLEMSRLARSSKDWHHLLEVCVVFGTLLGDQDGIYDPTDPNDRLLLGLKGTMSEVELQTMRNRLERGRLHKAQRGALFTHVPVGYVILPTGEAVKDPDAQARSVMAMLFEKFEELGSAHSLLRWFHQQEVCLPFRPRNGPRKGDIDWHLPSSTAIFQILHHPMYAGVYTYGRRREDPKLGKSAGHHPRKKWLPVDKCEVVIHDHLPAYITWDQFLKNLERLQRNRTCPAASGVPRNGAALLTGLVVCGRCGRKMQANYRHKHHSLYVCSNGRVHWPQLRCQVRVPAQAIDGHVVRQVLLALEPAALQVSLQAQSDVRRERERLEQHWQQKRKRAQYDADLAARRYRAVDPENRLVASTLEQHWEEALREQRRLDEDYHRFRRQMPSPLRPDEESQILALASTITTLWNSANTTNADRQAIIRCVVDKVVVDKVHREEGQLTVHWKGGAESRLEFVCRVRVYEQLQNFDPLMARVVELRKAGNTPEKTAEILNSEGFRTCQPGQRFDKDSVRRLLLKRGYRDERRAADLLQADEWLLRPLARQLGIPHGQLNHWVVRGWVHARKSPVRKLWILWVDAAEMKRLQKLRNGRAQGVYGYPQELITPKPRKKLA
jgi:DNA invertase Pin-like site-specific DNA recombinase